MIRIGFVLAGCLVVLGCEKPSEGGFLKMNIEYPERLEYDPRNTNYRGAPCLEFRRDKIDAYLYGSGSPIVTFEKAFEYAKSILSDYFTADLIERQMPLLIDYRDGIWIVNGSLKSVKAKGSVVVGGVAEMAFVAETGEVLYIFHSL